MMTAVHRSLAESTEPIVFEARAKNFKPNQFVLIFWKDSIHHFESQDLPIMDKLGPTGDILMRSVRTQNLRQFCPIRIPHAIHCVMVC